MVRCGVNGDTSRELAQGFFENLRRDNLEVFAGSVQLMPMIADEKRERCRLAH
jgi:hypothetical protein